MMRALVFGLAMLGAVSPSLSQSLRSDEVLSSFSVQPISAPNPVLGADDRVHLAYELLVANNSRLFVTLDKVEAVDPAGAALWSLEGDPLAALTMIYAGSGRTVSPGGTAAVFMDVSFAKGTPLPADVAVRITATRQAAGPDGKPVPMPADAPLPSTFTFTGASTPIGKPAVRIQPPLRGKGWIAVNGCCDSITSHRGAVIAVNGTLRVPERFAIDFVRIDDKGRLFVGPATALSSYPYYGTAVHSVADGVVVNLYDDTDEQVPSEPAKGITPANIGGNMLVIDIGGGAYAFYAHMQRGSLKVKLGDKVRAGDVIGLLGNTGNTTAPHLHFHVMDGISPLDANGLPYVFDRFSSPGSVKDVGNEDPTVTGAPFPIDAGRFAGDHIDQLPLNDQVVDFE